MTPNSTDRPLCVEAWREPVVECVHLADAAVVDADGAVLAAHGDIDKAILPRSSIKALQALPLVESGAAEAFALDDRALALACASHSGGPAHVALARDMLAAGGLGPDALGCGAHAPLGAPERRALREAGGRPTPLHNCCSGKHAGMLLGILHRGKAADGYLGRDHPYQVEVARALEETTGVPHPAHRAAIDGCSLPNHPIPLRALAGAFARFGVDRLGGEGRAAATRRLREACLRHPDLVAGEGRCCTDVMRALGGRAFVKVGAEGVYVAALPEQGLGIALKVRDGLREAGEIALVHLVSTHLELDDTEQAALAGWATQPIRNWRGVDTGRRRMTREDRAP